MGEYKALIERKGVLVVKMSKTERGLERKIYAHVYVFKGDIEWKERFETLTMKEAIRVYFEKSEGSKLVYIGDANKIYIGEKGK